MRSWHPDNWDQERTDYLTNTDNSYLGCTEEAKRIYEAGADAMYKAVYKGLLTLRRCTCSRCTGMDYDYTESIEEEGG